MKTKREKLSNAGTVQRFFGDLLGVNLEHGESNLVEADIAARLALKIRVKAYVLDVKYEKSFQTDIVTRVSKIFRESGGQRPLRH